MNHILNSKINYENKFEIFFVDWSFYCIFFRRSSISGRLNQSSSQILSRTPSFVVEHFGSPLPVLITEALKFSDGWYKICYNYNFHFICFNDIFLFIHAPLTHLYNSCFKVPYSLFIRWDFEFCSNIAKGNTKEPEQCCVGWSFPITPLRLC